MSYRYRLLKANAMVLLWTLPPETLDRCLAELDPLDVSAFAQTCATARLAVYCASDSHLWRELFLNLFDDPRRRGPKMGKGGEVEGEEEEQKVDWLGQLQSRITLRQVLAAEDEPTFLIRAARRYPDGTYAEIYRQVSDLVASAHRDKSISKNLAFLKQHLSPPHAQLHVLHFHGHTDSSHSLFSSRPSKANAVVGSAAKLHTMFGLTSFDTATSRARGMAREACYDTRNYRAANFYGPFKDDGSGAVHWPQMEALSVVLALNVLDVRRHAHEDDQDDAPPHPPPPQGFASAGPSGILEECPLFEGLAAARPYTQPKTIGTEEAPGDWAGVQGKWTRIVCFLDFRDLHRFNFGPLGLNFGQAPTHGFGIGPGTPETDPGLLSPGSAMIIGGGQIWSRPRLDDYTEAIRLMTLDLKVTSVGEPAEGAVVPDGMANGGPRYPPIFFNGTSAPSAFGHPVSQVRGCVSRTPDGEVRWTLVSTYAGEDRWASEGIQVGGVRSAMGVIGVWSDVDRADAEAPAGPFAFYKIAA